VRAATVAAGLLACAAAAMAAAAFTAGDDGDEEQRAAAVARATPEPAVVRDGKAVWVANGCGSCHAFAAADARGEIGPNLSATLKGMPASYIRESIVEPSKVAAAGYGTGMMPEYYSARIAPAELEALVAFIRSGVRD
jgi:cytochrome c553